MISAMRAGRRGSFAALAAAALIFGTTFTTVQGALRGVDTFAFLVLRFGIGTAALVAVRLQRGLGGGRVRPPDPAGTAPRAAGEPTGAPRLPWAAGAVAGAALFAGYAFQTSGLRDRSLTPSMSAFITYLLVVMVPFLEAGLTRRRPSKASLAAALLALVGLDLLTGAGTSLELGRGALLTVAGAAAYAVHLVVLGQVARRHDVLALTLVQLGTVTGLAGAVALASGASFAFPARTWLAGLYLGLAASAVAFLLQSYGQRGLDATRAALVLLLEPVFAAALDVVLGRSLAASAVLGAALILGAVLAAGLGQGSPAALPVAGPTNGQAERPMCR